MNPDVKQWIGIWLVLCCVGYLAMSYFYPLFWPLQLLAVTNTITLVLVVLDKFFASMRSRRVPEVVLYIATFFGGSIGMSIGMFLFHHKTRKVSFQFVVGLLVLIQVGLIAWMMK